MLEEIIIAGFGGQGVMVMGRLLAYAGMVEGKHVSWIPSYGPEMRGGTANCCVVISCDPIGSPVVSEPDTVIAMNRPSLERFEHAVKPSGLLIYNSSLVDIAPERRDVTVIAVRASDIAAELGDVRAANMVALGAYLKARGAVSRETVVDSIRAVMPRLSQDLIDLNVKAIDKGMDIAGDQLMISESIS
jgi:2-oxoglutarate ferredoxin oxidoreductase subunit gamma